jgi:predicted metal-dependent HD superfamily phosphohydrolase
MPSCSTTKIFMQTCKVRKKMPVIFFNLDVEDITFLKSQWDSLVSNYPSNKIIKEEVFQVLQERYSEKNRFYHNFNHVQALLKLFESFENKIRAPHAVKFSIWFHDVIYDSKRNDNEAESAKLASEMLYKLNVNPETIELVRDLILATKDHSGKNLSSNAKLFLDMDLAILGMNEEIYKEYSQAIGQEYAWLSESMYREGRKKVLKSFVEREWIYSTDEMKARYEAQARKNINSEIESLGAQKKTDAQ